MDTVKLNILSFNWHAPYLYLLSKLGHQFIVVEPEIAPGVVKHWETEMRPLPGNVRLVSEKQARLELDQGNIDLVLAHNVKDLILANGYQVPKIMVFHNKLSTEIGLSNTAIDRNDYLQKLQCLRGDINEIYISESKRRDWGGEGEIILPGIDISEYGGYTGENSEILRIGNHFKERDLMLGYTTSQEVADGFPCITLGINPTIEGSSLARNFEELKDHFRRCRVYLNTTVEKYEDGYNLAMLEAMATGMPVVSTFNHTSPIIDGVNGFISDDISYLRQRVAMLLNDPRAARQMGEKARQTVIQQFSLDAFLDKWHKAIHQAIRDFLKNIGVASSLTAQPFHEKESKNVLMDYVSNPAGAAYYLERALRKSHNVITCGDTISPDTMEQWNLENLNWPITPQDFPRKHAEHISKIVKSLPDGWVPDLYFWVETGLGEIPVDLDALSIPKACYLIDTHDQVGLHKKIARQFDFVFLAQKEYVDAFKASGCANVYWLPLACDADIHGKVETEKRHEVSFVGSITSSDTKRKKLLEKISRHCDLFMDRKFMDERALIYSQSKIVFQPALSNDLNMRVFEALCSGSLLVTDRVSGSGLEEMFEDGKHLVYYDEDNLTELIQYYLTCSLENDRIAEQGRREVLEKHTYGHRVSFMMAILDECFRMAEVGATEVGATETGTAEIGTAETGASVSQAPQSASHSNPEPYDVLPLVPEDAACILIVGQGTGMAGRALKEKGKFVAAVELNPEAVNQARQILDDVVEGDLETLELPYGENSFDCIILADVPEHLAESHAAMDKLKKCLKPNGTLVAAHKGMPVVDNGKTRESLLQEAEEQEKKNDFINATAIYKQVLEQSADCAEALVGLGNCNLKTQEAAVAETYYQRAFEIDPHSAGAQIGLGLLACLNEKYDEAIARFHGAIHNHPSHDRAFCGLGLAYYQKGEKDKSLQFYSRSLELNIENKTAMISLLNVSYELNRFDRIEHALKKYLDLHPANLNMLFGLAGIEYKTHRVEKARETAKLVLLFQPDHDGALVLIEQIETVQSTV